ncbi:Lysine-specific demethylase 4D [Metarhizium brunneum]|uniref:Lysine-specific demethylase 4D n=1 Tax=Metarhizium brunneum TaxID=500148 RepID=A0A7D5Z087_9HYPO
MDGYGHHGGGASASPSLTVVPAPPEATDVDNMHIRGPSAVAIGHAHRQTTPVEQVDDIFRVPGERPADASQSEGPTTILQEPAVTSDEVAQEAVARPASDLGRIIDSEVKSGEQDTINKLQRSPVTTESVATGSTTIDDAEAEASVPQIPITRDGAGMDNPRDQPKEPDVAPDIKHNYDQVDGHRILRLQPTKEQWDDFPAVLAYAKSLGAEGDGCFKVIIPETLQEELPEKPAQNLLANAYKVKLMRRTSFWQVSTVPSEGVFASSSQSGTGFSEPVDALLKNLKHLFRKQQNKQLRNIRYRVDVPAWTKTQRRLAGVPEKSPIYPLKGDKLDNTKAVIPGIHTPYVYESASAFGATFQIHAEDFRLASLNHLYKGRKIWIVIPTTDVDVAERALGRGLGCSQFMRHRAEFFFPDKLQKLGIPYRIVDQRPGETIVILPDAYHEGFSCGYTIAEAKNYADPAWTTDSYQPCQASCRLATAIPAAFMRPLGEGEQRLDLCAAYGDGLSIPVVDLSKKREQGEMDGGQGPLSEGLEAHEPKRIKVCE